MYVGDPVPELDEQEHAAFLVNIANAWIDRQNLLDPIKLLLKSHGLDDIELRFRNTVLTTLDSGAGTQKTLS